MSQTAPLVSPAPETKGADFVSTFRCASSVGKVFAALTEPARLASWWTDASGSGLQGGELTFAFGRGRLVVRVDQADRSLVQWTPLVCDPVPDWESTTIAFALSEADGGATRVDFRHAGLAELECFDLCREGWAHYLPSLVDYVDTGKGSPREV